VGETVPGQPNAQKHVNVLDGEDQAGTQIGTLRAQFEHGLVPEFHPVFIVEEQPVLILQTRNQVIEQQLPDRPLAKAADRHRSSSATSA
jgi:hypothetical protein